MKVLVIGSGAREHALVRALSRDASVDAVVAAPGNPGIGLVADCRPVDVADPDAVADLASSLAPDLVVIGPEVPLVAGAADAIRARGIPCFGPSARAARLEGSKAYAKRVMAEAGVPTAMAHVCTTVEQAESALDAFGPPYVVKYDGLAGGKGVVVTHSREDALAHTARSLERVDGVVLVEEYLDGPEVSLFCVTDGRTVVPLEPAQDFKRVGDADTGPNTGGMGAYSPLPWAPPDLVEQVVARVAQPVVDLLRRQGDEFAGLLYCGLALTSRGIRVVEFNVRFGDPEAQVVLARLATPLAGVLLAAATGRLDEAPRLRWHDQAAVTVVLAAAGYPGTVRSGDPITGLDDADALDDVHVLHAGTGLADDGTLVSAGGRVLSVVGTGRDLAAARAAAYEGIGSIHLEGSHFRTDIAQAAAEWSHPAEHAGVSSST
ncbi:MAG: phosphoribosylamine--glycine ligase [Actinomycetes bacterium]